MTGIDRTPKPCLHKRAAHQHSTHACYVLDQCRCIPCRDANTIYERSRSRRLAYGRPAFVDAEPARLHVKNLMAAGVGLKRITVLSGVSCGVLWKLMYGKKDANGVQRPTVGMRQRTIDRLLAVSVTDLAGGARMPAIGAQRRVQALVATGWSMTKIAGRLGCDVTAVSLMLRGDQLTVRTSHLITELYDELWNTAPPATTHREKISVSRARNHAALHGWAPPMAWDDDAIDDPLAVPDHDTTAMRICPECGLQTVARSGLTSHASAMHGLNLNVRTAVDRLDDLDEFEVELLVEGRLTSGARVTPELVEAVRRLVQLGLTNQEIGDRIGRSRDAVMQICARNTIDRKTAVA